MKPGTKLYTEIVSTGEEVGRDPRKMSVEELESLGHKPMTPLKALRARCIDCCVGQVQEVRYCTAYECASWPFRMNKNPWKAPRVLSDEDRALRAERLKAARGRRRVTVSDGGG